MLYRCKYQVLSAGPNLFRGVYHLCTCIYIQVSVHEILSHRMCHTTQNSLYIFKISPELSLLAHTKYGCRLRQDQILDQVLMSHPQTRGAGMKPTKLNLQDLSCSLIQDLKEMNVGFILIFDIRYSSAPPKPIPKGNRYGSAHII